MYYLKMLITNKGSQYLFVNTLSFVIVLLAAQLYPSDTLSNLSYYMFNPKAMNISDWQSAYIWASVIVSGLLLIYGHKIYKTETAKEHLSNRK